MNRPALKRKINEDHWVDQWQKASSVHYLKRSYEPAVPGTTIHTVSLPAGLLQQWQDASLGKGYNKYLFLLAALYIWTRRFTGHNGQQLLALPALAEQTADRAPNLVFVPFSWPAPDTVRDLLKKLHEALQQAAARSDYDFKSFYRRVTHGATAAPAIAHWGLSYNQVNGAAIDQQHVSLSFAVHEADNGTCDLALMADNTLLNEADMAAIGRQFIHILRQLCGDIQLPVSKLDLVPAEDRQLITHINDNDYLYEPVNSFPDLFYRQVSTHPQRTAVVFEDTRLSYAALDAAAELVARDLINRGGVQPGELVGLLVGHTTWRIISILGILKAGAGYVPMKPDFPVKRLRFMLQDCHCRVLLTEERYRSLVQECDAVTTLFLSEQAAPAPELSTLHSPAIINHATPFVVLYTSGSSGQPKGVLIDHGNMVDRLMGEMKLYDIDGQVCTIQTSNYAFDSSLLDLFLPLAAGGRLVIPGEETLTDYEQLANLINRQGVTDLQANPNFLKGFLDTCIHLQVSFTNSLKRIWSGGESLTHILVEQVKTYFPGVIISNHYGPTEGTVDSLVHKDVKGFTRNIVGKPIFNMNAWILDESLSIQPVLFPGEICIAGKGLARGYLNQPELTAQKFIDHPLQPGVRLYRTGDLGRLLPDGNIEYLGRIDDQIKIRGYRIELGEVEQVIRRHRPVRDVVVLAKTDETGMKFLVAFLELIEEQAVGELRTFLQTELPDFMIPAYFVVMDRFPVTATGKTDRKALDQLPYAPKSSAPELLKPRNSTEERLLTIWQKVLGKEIGTNSNFFESGGQSLKAVQMIFQVYRDFNIKLSIKDIFDAPTIIKLAGSLSRSGRKEYQPIPRVADDKELFEASPAQSRIWLPTRQKGLDTAYNLPDAYLLNGVVDEAAFGEALLSMAERHESLRTTFLFDENGLQQKIHRTVPGHNYHYTDLSGLPEESVQEQTTAMIHTYLRWEFDLEKGPLWKADLVKLHGNKYLLLICFHHIICDEWSLLLFIEDFLTFYSIHAGISTSPVAPLPVQYKDYSVWKRSLTDTWQKEEAFWVNQFSGQLPVLQLPYDGIKTGMAGIEQKVITTVGVELLQQLKAFSNKQECTLFITLLTLFNVFLHKISGQEDIIVGTITSGRDNPDLDRLIGYFVNTLALRNRIQPDQDLVTLLQDVKERTLEAFMHQGYEFEELIRKISSDRSYGANPLFDVLFEFQNAITIDSPLFSISSFAYEYRPVAKFDLNVSITEESDTLTIVWNYDSSLFSGSTILQLAHYYLETITRLLRQPGLPVSQVDLLNSDHALQPVPHLAGEPSTSGLFNF